MEGLLAYIYAGFDRGYPCHSCGFDCSRTARLSNWDLAAANRHSRFVYSLVAS
jgi:hypothetical protein